MKPTPLQKAALLACITCCGGCFAAVSDVRSIGNDTYLVTSQAKNGWSTRGAQKTKAYEKSHAFCMASGKEMQTITSEVSSRGEPAYAELVFRCVADK